MRRWGLRLLWTVLVAVLLLGTGLLALQYWVGSDDFRSRLQSQAESMLGVPVVLGRLHVDPWPVPAIAMDAVELRTGDPLTAQRMELRLRLDALLAGRLEVASLRVQGAGLPQTGIDQLLAAIRGKADAADPGAGKPGGTQPLAVLPRRLLLSDVTWRNLQGDATTIDADATLGGGGVLEALALTVRAGAFQGAQLQASRAMAAAQARAPIDAQPNKPPPSDMRDAASGRSWDIRVQHAGGTITGVLAVQGLTGDAQGVSVRGNFDTRDLELSALRKGAPGPLSGRLQASTTVSAQAASTAGLAAALMTQSRFTVQEAVLQGVDLVKAVQTVGLSRGGQTRLDNLAGQVTTRGAAIQLSNLATRSGALSATGDVAVTPNRGLTGRIQVQLEAQVVGKAVGVPLVVGGTLDAPTVTLTRSAMLGAAIGTLVMPGVGTGAGASLGDAIGEKLKDLFGK